MGDNQKREALLAWTNLFSEELGFTVESFESLKDSVAYIGVFQYLSGEEVNLEAIRQLSTANDWFGTLKEVRAKSNKVTETLKNKPEYLLNPDITALVRRGDLEQVEKLLTMLLFYSIRSSKKHEAVERLKQLPKMQQIEIKKMLKPPAPAPVPEAETPPPKVEANKTDEEKIPIEQPPTPVKQANTNPCIELKKQIEKLKSENAKLAEENKYLEQEINNQSNTTANVPHAVSMLAAIKAEIFTLDVANQTKMQKKQQLCDIEQHVITLQAKIEEAKAKIAEKEQALNNFETKKKDKQILYDILQGLRLDPQQQVVSDLSQEGHKLKKIIRGLKVQKQNLQAALDGQQDSAVLEERYNFVKEIEKANQKRLLRAKLNTSMLEKRMRTDAFIHEMRSFI